jgi:hypothetical protein
MMGRSLLLVGVLGTAGLAVAGALGYGLTSPGDAGMPRHIIVALASILMLMFSHCWILLYLLGTGRVIRQGRRGLPPEAAEPAALAGSRRARRVGYTALAAAALLALAEFLLGGAVAANAAPHVLHHVFFWAALAAQGVALWGEGRALAANESLLGEIDGRLIAADMAAAR